MSPAVFILNRSPTKALKGQTPYEAWHGRKPNVSFLRTFGCIGHVKTTKLGLGKLEDRSTKMVFLGYEEGSKAYRLYDPVGGKVVVSRDVIFNEAAAWKWDGPRTGEDGGTGGIDNTFTVERLVIRGTEVSEAIAEIASETCAEAPSPGAEAEKADAEALGLREGRANRNSPTRGGPGSGEADSPT